MIVIASRDELHIVEVSPGRGSVFDSSTEALYPEMDVDALLNKGYWEEPTINVVDLIEVSKKAEDYPALSNDPLGGMARVNRSYLAEADHLKMVPAGTGELGQLVQIVDTINKVIYPIEPLARVVTMNPYYKETMGDVDTTGYEELTV